MHNFYFTKEHRFPQTSGYWGCLCCSARWKKCFQTEENSVSVGTCLMDFNGNTGTVSRFGTLVICSFLHMQKYTRHLQFCLSFTCAAAFAESRGSFMNGFHFRVKILHNSAPIKKERGKSETSKSQLSAPKSKTDLHKTKERDRERLERQQRKLDKSVDTHVDEANDALKIWVKADNMKTVLRALNKAGISSITAVFVLYSLKTLSKRAQRGKESSLKWSVHCLTNPQWKSFKKTVDTKKRATV